MAIPAEFGDEQRQVVKKGLVRMQPTVQLARSIAEFDGGSVPPEVRHRARQCILDFLGVALGAARDPMVDILLKVAAMDFPAQTGAQIGAPATAQIGVLAGPGMGSAAGLGAGSVAGRRSDSSTVLGRPERTGLLWAALVNGAMAHLLDFDDTHQATILHGYTPTLGALLPLAERLHSTGAQLETAFVAGYETAARVALAVCPAHYDRGWHVTGTAGVFGAAAAAARLLGLDAGKTAHALGIAAAQAAGLREMFGTMTKPLHAGKAAQNGLLAALLAAEGCTSSTRALEAPRGFCAVLSDQYDVTKLTEGWGGQWELMKLGFKPYPCGVVTHAAIDASLALGQMLRERGIAPDAKGIASIELACHPLVLELTGKPDPRVGLEGKFSVYHCIAAGLIDGQVGPQSFTDEAVVRPQVRRVRNLVKAAVKPGLGQDQAELTLKTRSGDILHHRVEHATGTLANPMTDQQLEAKLRLLLDTLALARAGTGAGVTRKWPGSDLADELIRVVDGLGAVQDASRLVFLCRQPL